MIVMFASRSWRPVWRSRTGRLGSVQRLHVVLGGQRGGESASIERQVVDYGRQLVAKEIRASDTFLGLQYNYYCNYY